MSEEYVKGLAEDKQVKYVKAILHQKENLPAHITEKRIEEIREWVHKTEIYLKFSTEIAPHILKQDILKELSALSLFSVRKPFYALVISEPAVAKSQVALWIEQRTPNTKFIEGTKLTSAGLTMTRVGKTIVLGALPQTHYGTLYLDELDKTPTTEAPALYSSMANHEFTVTKAILSATHVPSRQSGVFYCNPKGEHFMSRNVEVIKSQIPFESQAFLTRFHITMCLFEYDIKEFEEVTRHQYRSELDKIHHSIIDENIQNWKDYVEYARKYLIQWNYTKKMEDVLAIFSREVYKQSSHLAMPVSARLNEGIFAIAEAYARTRLDAKVTIRHVVKAMNLYLECLEGIGLDKRIVIVEIKKYISSFE
jgi:DNA replicative helicase MCM subunit Mcm2 (Cdc46/Mcm family)